MDYIKWLLSYIPGRYRASELGKVNDTKKKKEIRLTAKNREQLDKLVKKMIVYMKEKNESFVNEVLTKMNVENVNEINYDILIAQYGSSFLLYKDSHKEIAMYVMAKMKSTDKTLYSKIIKFLELLNELLF